MKQYVEVRGKELFFNNKELRLRGFGIGTWLNMEHFMIGLPTPDSMIRNAFEEVYGEGEAKGILNSFINSFASKDDFKYLKSIGVNFVRVPFNYRLLIDDNTGEYKEEGFDTLKNLFDLCEENEIFCMPDLHTTPGGQNPDWHSDNRTGVPEFWQFYAFRHQIAKLWGEIAKRFSHYSYILGYDLLNEPAMASWDALNSFYAETIREIRKYDKNHAVVLEGDYFAMDFSHLDKFQDEKQLILSFHFYPTVWKKHLLDKNLSREDRIFEFEEGFSNLVSIRDTFERPVICGEAGYDLNEDDMDFSMELLEDTLNLFEKYKVSWSIWAYKDACFMGMVHPKKDSMWMKLSNKIKLSWTHYGEMEQANKIMDNIGGYFSGIDEDMKYKMQFRIRGILYEIQKEKILKPLLREISFEEIKSYTKDFSFENCEIHKQYQELIKKYT